MSSKFITCILILLIITGCAGRKNVRVSTPPWPYAGPDVATELKEHCPETDAEGKPVCPALWDWINRLSVLKEQLLAQEPK